jgi:predicted ATPase
VVERRDNDYFGSPVNRAARIMSVAHGGQVLLSQAVADCVRDLLPAAISLRDLGKVRLKDLSTPEHVYQVVHPQLRQEFPALRSLEATPNNLPQQATSFIGREQALAELRRLLAKTRLLTLTGSGGCGKTRLCLQIAADSLESFDDGAWMVEFAPLSDPDRVPQTVAMVLGLKEALGRTISQTLTEYLKDKRLLLLLDNCEHLLEGCARLADMLVRQCPHLTILASSREPLGIGGEQAYRVPSLSLPDSEQVHTPVSVTAFEAVQLFIDRALLVRADFEVTNRNASTLASICHRLDGIPLAIELAAARVRSLSVEEINRKLDERFRLLTGGSRTALPRQQTLRAAIEWSHALLTDDERIVFRRLGAFTGGFSLPLAQAVASDNRIDAWMVLELLSHLVDKSLVATDLRDTAAEPRYRLLESTRAYALEQLAAAGETQPLLRRHAQALHDVLLPLQLRFWSLTDAERGAAIAELDNLRAAHDWCVAPDGDRALGCALLAASRATWFGSGQLMEGVERCLRAPAVSLSTDVEARLKLTIAHLGYLTPRADCFEAAGRAADLFGQLGDPMSQAGALMTRVHIGARRGMTAEAGEALDAAKRLVRPDWPPWLRGYLAFARMNYLLMVDDAAGALDAAWQQYECWSENRIISRQPIALVNVANCETVLGRYESAIERLEGLLNQKQRFAFALGCLARTLVLRNGPGDVERALAYGSEAWPLLRRQSRAIWLLEDMGVAHARRGAPELAARLIGHARAACSQDGEVEFPFRRRIIGSVLEELRARHGQAQVDGWCAIGAGLNDDQAASLAFESATLDPRPSVA